MTPQGRAIWRLVAPVAIERPTLLEKVDWPTPPKRPTSVVPMEAARIPPLTDFKSVRFHSRSLAFWHNVRSPTLLRVDARQAMKNAGNNAMSNDQPVYGRCGKLTIDPTKDLKNSDALERPSA
jgi:hypothetical protein